MRKRVLRAQRRRSSQPIVGSLVTTGSPTLSGTGSCTIDATGSDRVQCPEAQALLDETQGWIAICFKPSVASTAANDGFHYFFQWADGGFDHEVFARYSTNVTYGALELGRGVLNADETTTTLFPTWAANDTLVFVAKWTATALGASVGGSTFTSVANTSIPTISATSFDIGSLQGSSRWINSSVQWMATGIGTLTNADAVTLNTLGTSNIEWNTLPAISQMTFRWTADNFNYEKPAPSSGSSSPTIASPASNSTITGIIPLRGTLDNTKTVSAVDVRYDSAPYRPATFRANKWRTTFNTTILSAEPHTFTVRVTYTDATTISTSAPVTVGFSTMVPGTSLLKLGGGTGYTAVSNKDKYTLFQIDGSNASYITDAAAKPTSALIWNWGTTVRKNDPTNNTIGVSYNECSAKGWIQKTSGNADVEYPNDTNQVFTKFGDANYIARVVDRFVNNPNTIADHNGTFLPGIFSQNVGIDGVMTDDTNASYSASSTTPSVTYATSVAWRDAMFLFLKGVGAGIQDAGYLYGCNPNSSSNEFVNAAGGWPAWGQAHDGSQLGFWVRAIAPYVDIIMCEYWMIPQYNDPVRILGSTAQQAFRENLANLMPAANETGTSWLMNLQVGMTADNGADDTNLASAYNQARMIYLKAAFLLKWDPTTGSTCDVSVPPAGYSSSAEPWNAAWTKNMGLPLGSMTEPVAGGFLRRYQNGSVFLNANASGSVTYPAPDNKSLAAKTALIEEDTTSGIMLIRYNSTEGTQAEMTRYGLVALSPYETADLSYIKARTVKTLVLAYQDATVAASGGTNPTATTSSSAVSKEEALAWDAAHPTDLWLLYDAASGGNPIPDKNYASDYFTNMGSLTYQARVVARLQAVITSNSPNFDGIELDNTTSTYLWRSGPVGGLQGYATPPSGGSLALLSEAGYKTNMINCLSYIRSNFSLYLAGNAGVVSDNDGSLTKAWWDIIYPSLDGLELEYFEQGPDKVLFYNDATDWHGYYNLWLTVVDKAQSLGKDFIGGASGPSTDTAKMMYVKASFLLKWNGTGHGSMFWQGAGAGTWNAAWTTWIGIPKGSMYAVSTGWRRDYTGGTVIVNPNKAGDPSITFNLGGTYLKPDLTPATNVTLAPVTAMILTTS